MERTVRPDRPPRARVREADMLQVGDQAPALELHPVFGLPVHTAQGTLVVAILRPLSGSTARLTIARLTEALPRFDTEGFRIVGITRTDLTLARDFVPRNHVLFPIVDDESGTVQAAFGVETDKGFVKSALGLRPSLLQSASEALGLGRAWNELPSATLPAWFVLRDGKVVYAHYARSVLEQPDIEALWKAATS